MTKNYVIPIAKALKEVDGNRFGFDHYMWFAWDDLRAHASVKFRPSEEDTAKWENTIEKS